MVVVGIGSTIDFEQNPDLVNNNPDKFTEACFKFGPLRVYK